MLATLQPVGYLVIAARGGAAEGDRQRRGKCDTRERQGEDEDQRNRRSPVFSVYRGGPSHSARMVVQACNENVTGYNRSNSSRARHVLPAAHQTQREGDFSWTYL
jgi:hypothetical protein